MSTLPPSASDRATVLGLAIGAVLGIVAVSLGFWAFLLVAVFMAIGALLARAATGGTDLRGVWDALRGRTRPQS